LLGLISRLEDRSDILFLNVGQLSADYRALHPGRYMSSYEIEFKGISYNKLAFSERRHTILKLFPESSFLKDVTE
jgi:hypothetical protein